MSNSKPERTMSSRLLTMKFMQRAAASAATSTSKFPTTQSSSTPHPNDDSADTRPSPKRHKLSSQNTSPLPATDLQAISAAVKAEEEKRAAAVARQAAEVGETQWVLKFPAEVGETQWVLKFPAEYGRTRNGSGVAGQPCIVSAGSLDTLGIDDDMDYGGRRSYGNFKRKKRVDANQHHSASANNSDDAGGENSETSNSALSSAKASDNGDVQPNVEALIRCAKFRGGRPNDRRKKGKISQGKVQSSRSGSGTPSAGGGKVNLRLLTSISGPKVERQQHSKNRRRRAPR